MPIKVIDNRTDTEIAWFCGEDWALDVQLCRFQSWLAENADSLVPGNFSADIGFSPRAGAAGGGGGGGGGGGASLSSASIAMMAKLGIELYFSEYPEFTDERFSQP